MRDDEALEELLLCKRDFKERIEPQVREKIKELRAEPNQQWALDRRKEYLERLIQGFERWLYWMNFKYALAVEADCIVWCRYLLSQIDLAQSCKADLERELKFLRLPKEEGKRSGDITEGMVELAKAYPFERLADFDRGGFTLCPFHQEKTGSLHLQKDRNIVYCFGSCHKAWDTIQFVRERDGLDFVAAVKSLQ